MTSVDEPAVRITDPVWLRNRIGLAAKLYGCAPAEVLGTIWWYSASSVLVAPALESLVGTGVAMDPSLEAVTLETVADGRFTGARSSRPLTRDLAELGKAFEGALEPAIATIAAVSGARVPALRAIATDSLANRLLWAGMAAGDPERGTALAGPLIAAIGPRMPRPRYVRVGASFAVRRASCCLIYQATGGDKCTSCPRQPPDERERRLRAALGA
ncbi:(2Fe-2S)-binding protein [Amycolatopsis nigrescens]|uniref:(2Fe-2S)-binding protein n=1 Tax=Amycolatopsis nigrescens TaxID=381445 RepID=UPI000380480E|nr:(2Fe-2S)-binding protein [Amycolatopsis nigrescens]